MPLRCSWTLVGGMPCHHLHPWTTTPLTFPPCLQGIVESLRVYAMPPTSPLNHDHINNFFHHDSMKLKLGWSHAMPSSSPLNHNLIHIFSISYLRRDWTLVSGMPCPIFTHEPWSYQHFLSIMPLEGLWNMMPPSLPLNHDPIDIFSILCL